jgi:hypothetical protein
MVSKVQCFIGVSCCKALDRLSQLSLASMRSKMLTTQGRARCPAKPTHGVCGQFHERGGVSWSGIIILLHVNHDNRAPADTVVAFHGDSTAYRAANQLDAFLTGLPYMGFKHDLGFNHLAVNGNRTVTDSAGATTALKPTWTSVRFLWAPHLRDLPGSSTGWLTRCADSGEPGSGGRKGWGSAHVIE